MQIVMYIIKGMDKLRKILETPKNSLISLEQRMLNLSSLLKSRKPKNFAKLIKKTLKHSELDQEVVSTFYSLLIAENRQNRIKQILALMQQILESKYSQEFASVEHIEHFIRFLEPSQGTEVNYLALKCLQQLFQRNSEKIPAFYSYSVCRNILDLLEFKELRIEVIRTLTLIGEFACYKETVREISVLVSQTQEEDLHSEISNFIQVVFGN